MKLEKTAGSPATASEREPAGKKQRERAPTCEDGATTLRLLSSLSGGDSLQRAAIISFRSTEEGVLARPHGG